MTSIGVLTIACNYGSKIDSAKNEVLRKKKEIEKKFQILISKLDTTQYSL